MQQQGETRKVLVLCELMDGTQFWATSAKANIDLGQQPELKDGLIVRMKEHVRVLMFDAQWHMGVPDADFLHRAAGMVGTLPPEVAQLLKRSPGTIILHSED